MWCPANHSCTTNLYISRGIPRPSKPSCGCFLSLLPYHTFLAILSHKFTLHPLPGHPSKMSNPTPNSESDSDVEFEDVPISHPTANSISHTQVPERRPWTPTLSLPPQRDTPIPAGSEEETQLRGRLSSGMERITYRQMKADMGMDAPETRASLRRYERFKELADDIEHLVDMLWASSTR